MKAEQDLVTSSRILPQSLNSQDRSSGAAVQDEDFSDGKSAEVAMATVDASLKNAETFEQLMTELAELENRIQQSADQSASVRVIVLYGFFIYISYNLSNPNPEMVEANC